MPKQTKEAIDTVREPSNRRQVSTARVDAPHIVSKKSTATAPPDLALAEAIAVVSGNAVVPPEPLDAPSYDTLDVQAQQLAHQLQEQQQRLDRREAHINALHADLDNRYRMARLWMAEHETLLTEKTASLEQKEREVAQCGSRIAAAKATQEESSQGEQNKIDQGAKQLRQREIESEETARRLARQEKQLHSAQAELEERRRRHEDKQRWDQQRYMARRGAFLELVRLQNAGIERRRNAVENNAARPASERDCKSDLHHLTGEGLVERQKQLEEAEVALAVEQQELFECRQKQAARQEALLTRAGELRDKLDVSRHKAAARIARQKELLNRRRKEIAGRKRALDETRREVVRIHRETLELRLAVEEIWTQLSTSASPAALTQSLGKVRHKLADHYRLAREEITTRQEELDGAREDLSRRHQELNAQKNGLEDWLARRQREHDEQTEALAARHRALEAREDEHAERWTQTYDRRLTLEQEIRRMRTAMRRGDQVAS